MGIMLAIGEPMLQMRNVARAAAGRGLTGAAITAKLVALQANRDWGAR